MRYVHPDACAHDSVHVRASVLFRASLLRRAIKATARFASHEERRLHLVASRRTSAAHARLLRH